MTIVQAQRRLLALFWSLAALTGIVCLVYETEWVTYAPVGEDPRLTFVAQLATQLTTIVCLPVALSMFRWKPMARRLRSRPGALCGLGSLRIALIDVPMLANTLFYEQTQLASFGYLAIISMLCLFFIYPSLERCRAETGESINGEEA